MSAFNKLSVPNKRPLAPPSPSPSNASVSSRNDGTPTKRIKRELDGGTSAARDNTPAALAAAAASKNYGSDMLTQLTYALDFLKSKGTPKTLQEVLDYLTIQHTTQSQQHQFAMLMQGHSQIRYTPSPSPKGANAADAPPRWRTGKYEYLAKIPRVKDKTSLLEHLQEKEDASGVSVKDLKDGWPDCDAAITELEREHKILVVRTKKDNHAKMVWLDDPKLAHHVDDEFKVMWAKVELPSVDDIVRKLLAEGLKPASEDPRSKKLVAPKKEQKKKRASRKSGKTTNAHMAGILKDFQRR